MSETKKQIKVSAEDLKALVISLSKKNGISEEDSTTFAECLIDANLCGIDTHGVSRLSIYLKRIKLGLINTNPNMKFEQRFPTAAVLDANNGLGQIAGVKAINEAVKIAQKYGVGAVGIKNSQHFGVLGYYCGLAAQSEVISLGYTNAEPALPAYGSYEAYFGTNPVAMGVPCGSSNPIIIDLSTSIVARGKIISASKQKIKIPEGWALDQEGNPTIDPDKALAGSVLTMAGPKGYALAMMVDILSGIISGSGNGKNVNSMYKDLNHPANVGHFFICLNIEAFNSKEIFFKRVNDMKDDLRKSVKRKGVSEIRIPGENKLRVRIEREKEGIPLNESIIKELRELAEQNGVGSELFNSLSIYNENKNTN
jgi:LDH2 family malate/lactate/ureidoglycolate dehydrogenase